MNLIDALDNLDVLPKAAQRAVAIALLIGLAYVPAVRQFYLDQARIRGEQISRTIMHAMMTPPGDSPSGQPQR